VNLVMGWKYQSNPENTVGVMKMAKSPEVLVTPSPDIGKILSALHTLKLEGSIDLISSIQVAQLALKHRQNKNQQQRMILFIGSPLQHVDSKTLSRLGATLKKNNVAVDIVSFGDTDVNTEKLTEFIKAVNSNDNSHLVTIEPNTKPLTDALRQSPIYGSGGGEGSSGASDFPFGIDPNEDPELLLALRASLEDQQKLQGTDKDTPMKEADTSAPSLPPLEEDDDELLRQAILMSLTADNNASAMETQPTSGQATEPKVESSPQVPEKTLAPETITQPPSELGTPNEHLTDATFVNDILKGLPGVDFNDPQIKSILAEMEGSSKKDEDEELAKAMQMSMEKKDPDHKDADH